MRFKDRMPILAAMMLSLSMVMTTGCVSLHIGTDTEPPEFEMDGLGSAYATMVEIPEYNGTFLTGHLFRSGKDTGELASVYLWPLGGVDVGLLGARLKLLPFEMGAGTLFYQPTPTDHSNLDFDATADVDD